MHCVPQKSLSTVQTSARPPPQCASRHTLGKSTDCTSSAGPAWPTTARHGAGAALAASPSTTSAIHAAAGRGVGPGRGGLGERSFCTAPSPSRPAPTVRFAGRPHALKMRGKCAWGACRPGLLVALWPGRPRPKQSRVRPPLSQSVRVLATHSRAGRRPRRLERSRSCTTRSRRTPPHGRLCCPCLSLLPQ